ncbi:MAG TPA: LysR family transcriptional regulator [Bradyrhizobium sp.]|jgi:DNA-binding transcriptional LysR family regulator|nr:LysR family transcriptional regulator [Bradyrhizobium sp.]
MTDLPHTQALRCFVTVAREGSVSRAATSLHLSQPAVSLQLKGLEESAGLLLFNRTPGGLTLTEAGSALLPHAQNALSGLSGFKAAADSLKNVLRETLRVGTVVDPEFTRLGFFIKELTASSPRIEVFLRHGMTDEVLAQIGRGELDVGFYIDATPERSMSAQTLPERESETGKFQFAPLMCFTYHVIAPLAWTDKVMGKGWRDLVNLPWLATPSPSAHRRLLDDIFRPFGVTPKRVAQTDQEETMIDFVESGIGLSLARKSILNRRDRKRNFVIADSVSITCDLSLACLTSRRHESIIACAFSAMKRAWCDVEPPPFPSRAAR